MYKLNPSNEWYLKSVEEENDYLDDSIGCAVLSNNSVLFSISPDSTNNLYLLKHSFSVLLHKLRIKDHLSISQLAKKLEVDPWELTNIESNNEYKPALRTLMQISKFYGLPYQVLAMMVGVMKSVNQDLETNLVRYAANSDKFESLSNEEKHQLNEIIKLIRQYGEMK